ncbi:hypothetical protein CP960_05065 [Malaciobacter halophilus]|uniref:Cytochrome c domain-containing protein n=1 Tax=Malaciobacter halophilus TaxID=197482 RepID=A0A2N1J3U4_9BACT|nr:cytochrome c [Malaciobacter halophilus]AXH08704.1 hypothetical protein AHALO_0303 [Malaciobacter halophilus]PKI81230.1 hypothetical protein CP960_05065 [Malaciobacter halophilus]
MKFLPSIALASILTATIATAQTTMCFKENHKDMSTIENTALHGGECKGFKSAKQMNNEGWKTDDIKITSTKNGNNYIYIFKKEEKGLSSVDQAALETKILQRLEQRKKEEIALKKQQIYVRKSKSGEKLYKNKCVSCHGEKGELKARNVSRPIKDLNLQDFAISIRDYNLGTYDRGMAFVMKPYALLMNDKDVKNVYIYLKSINQKKEEEKTK